MTIDAPREAVNPARTEEENEAVFRSIMGRLEGVKIGTIGRLIMWALAMDHAAGRDGLSSDELLPICECHKRTLATYAKRLTDAGFIEKQGRSFRVIRS